MISASDLALLHTLDRYAPDRSARLLEVGSGSGRITRELLAAGYENIVVTDMDPWAEGQAPDGVRFVLQDSAEASLPVEDGAASVVLLVHVIEHIANPDRLLTDVRRVLRPGGVAIVVTPDFRRSIKTFYEDRTHVHPYVAKSLNDALTASGLRVVRLTHTNVMRPLGRLRPLWRRVPALVFTGSALLAVAER